MSMDDDDDEDSELDEETPNLSDDEIFALYHDHDEKYFKKSELGEILIGAEFLKERFEYV